MEMDDHLRAAEIIATMLDNRFSIGGMKFGIGAFIELIPEIGDILVLFLSFYLVWIGVKMKIPSFAIAHMVTNIMFITAIGTIPIAGDLAYILYRANMRNMEILKRYANKSAIDGGRGLSSLTQINEVPQ